MPKKFEKGIWIANSTAVIFSAFWSICLLQDLLVWVLGNLMGLPLALAFDQIFSTVGTVWSTAQVLVLFGFVPVYFLLVALISGMLYRRYRLKRDLRKLYFLWMQYFALAIFGGSFVTSFIERGNVRIFWDYMQLSPDFLPLVAFATAALLVFFGTMNLWKFLNISPSSEINKDSGKRLTFLLCIQVLPLLIFYTVGYVLYPHREITSRFFSSLLIWVPVIAGLIASMLRESGYSKVPAFKESSIRGFQPLYVGLAALIYLFVLLVA